MTTLRRARVALELGTAGLSGCLFVLTLAWRDWIEAVLGLDLDRGSGSLEILVAAALLAVAVATGALARLEQRRPALGS